MANIFSNTGTQVLSNLVLDEYVKALSPISAFTLDASPSAHYRGDTIKVLSVGTASLAQTFTKTAGYTMQDSQASTVSVTLNHYYTSAELSDADWRDSGLMSIDVFARSKGHALAESVNRDVLSFFTSSVNCPTSMSLNSGSFNVDKVTEITVAMDDNNVPSFGRVLILNPQYHQILRKDDSIKNAVAYGGPEVIRKGEILSVDGFEKVIKCNNLPSGVVGYAVSPTTAVVAMRAVDTQDDTMYKRINVFPDEETGISVTNKVWGNPDMSVIRSVWESQVGWSLANNLGIVKLYEE